MEFIIARDSFIQALSRVSGFVDTKGGNSSILSSVLLQADSSGLRYTGTDKTLTVLGQVAATVSRPGEAAVDASNLLKPALARGELRTIVLFTVANNATQNFKGRIFTRIDNYLRHFASSRF